MKLAEITGTRRDILGLILANPGIHFRAIARELDIGVGTVDYHLHALTKADLVHSTTIRNSRCIYPQGSEDCTTALLRRESLRRIVTLLLAHPDGMRITQIAHSLHKAPSTISSHVSALCGAGILCREVDLIRITKPQLITQKINALAPSRIDHFIENYVQMWID